MADDKDENEKSIAEDIVVTKYSMAGEIANDALKKVVAACVPGVKVLELCILGDQYIETETTKVFKKDKEMKKGIAFPTCVSINHIVCHYSPLKSDGHDVEIKDGDLVKLDLGAHIDGFAAVVAHTFVIGASKDKPVKGRKADVILAAHTAAEVTLRLMKSGVKNYTVTEYVGRAADSFKCKPVEGFESHQMKQHVYDAEKAIVWNPTEEQRKAVEACTLEMHEVWQVDVLISTGDGKVKESADLRTTLYKRKDTKYLLKMKASRDFYSEMSKKFQFYPFSLRSCEEERKARMGVLECAKHDLVDPLPVYHDKDGEFVAQFRFTVLLLPNGPMRITGLPVDTACYQSEYKCEDELVNALLAQSVSRKAVKKKKKRCVDSNFDEQLATQLNESTKLSSSKPNAKDHAAESTKCPPLPSATAAVTSAVVS